MKTRIVAKRRRRGIAVIPRLMPPDMHHPEPHVLEPRLQRAAQRIQDSVERIGYGEVFWIAAELGFEDAVTWMPEQENEVGDDKMILHLSELRLIAFAAALRAHHEVITAQLQGPLTSKERKRLKKRLRQREIERKQKEINGRAPRREAEDDEVEPRRKRKKKRRT